MLITILKYFILLGLAFFNFNYAQAKGIPACSKKITKGCIVKHKNAKAAKQYYAAHKSSKAKSKVKSSKRSTASELQLKLKKVKTKKKKNK